MNQHQIRSLRPYNSTRLPGLLQRFCFVMSDVGPKRNQQRKLNSNLRESQTMNPNPSTQTPQTLRNGQFRFAPNSSRLSIRGLNSGDAPRVLEIKSSSAKSKGFKPHIPKEPLSSNLAQAPPTGALRIACLVRAGAPTLRKPLCDPWWPCQIHVVTWITSGDVDPQPNGLTLNQLFG